MLRFSFLLAFALLAFTSCDPKTDVQDAVDKVDEVAGEVADKVDDVVNPVVDMDAVEGDGEVKVVDGTIKSPRKELSGTIAGVSVLINYGSPAVNERVIYGDLVPFNKVWRTGANEATRITFGDDVIVGADAKKLKKGTYSLFTLPSSKDEWTIIFNNEAEQWGAYDYNVKKDAVRAAGMSTAAAAKAERMDFQLDGETIKLMWDDLVVEFPVSASSK